MNFMFLAVLCLLPLEWLVRAYLKDILRRLCNSKVMFTPLSCINKYMGLNVIHRAISILIIAKIIVLKLAIIVKSVARIISRYWGLCEFVDLSAFIRLWAPTPIHYHPWRRQDIICELPLFIPLGHYVILFHIRPITLKLLWCKSNLNIIFG